MDTSQWRDYIPGEENIDRVWERGLQKGVFHGLDEERKFLPGTKIAAKKNYYW